MKTAHVPIRAPRQLSEQREQELLAAAREIFFARGVTLATMDEIAARAGVSKTTIYRRYKSKEEMFKAIIIGTTREMASRLEGLTLDAEHPAQSLRAAAELIRKTLLAPEYLALMRQMLLEAERLPELSRQARDLMTEALTRPFVRFFTTLIAAGRMQHDYPEQAAITFVMMSSAGYRPLLNAMGSDRTERRRMKADIEMFLRGGAIT